MNTDRSTVTGRLMERGRWSVPNTGRLSVASNYTTSTSMDLTYRDYFGAPNYTPFDEKMIELDFVKARAKAHLKKIHSLKINYIDWFTKKCKSFLDAVKLTQILAAKIVPGEIKNMGDFKKVYDISKRFPRNGTPRDNGPVKMDEFYMFWMEMNELKEETVDIYEGLCRYCESVQRLRHPSIKVEIDRLKGLLDEAFAEDFDFTDLKNDRDNLFVYKLAPFDTQFHGLLGYIPFLLTGSVKMLSWVRKVHLEKE